MNFNLKFYWALFLRRLPVMMALLLICSGAGLVTAFKLPPTYTTQARMLVEAPQIQVERQLEVEASEQLQVIEQRLMTRANLIDIANRYQVFADLRQMNPDQVVSNMREGTRIRRTAGRGEAATMTVQFTARTGAIAANVVNAYVTLILDASTRQSEEVTENNLNFFEQEVARLGQDLDRQSLRIVEFRNQNPDSLPEGLTSRQARQFSLQERLGLLERERASLISRRAELVKIYEQTGQVQTPDTPNTRLSREEQQLRDLELQRDEFLTIYSETNPRVIQLDARIAALRTRVANLPTTDDSTPTETTPAVTALDVSLADMDQRLKDIELELSDIQEDLRALDRALSQTAANAITLDSLDREYENIERQLNEAVNNLNQARINDRIIASSQGQRIELIEGAAVPQEPSGPNRPQIAAMGIGAGLALAAGFFALLEIVNRTIRRPAELQMRFGITPLASIPYIEAERERFVRRAVLIGAVVAVLIGVPAGLYYIDTQFMPLEILTNRVLGRIGLT